MQYRFAVYFGTLNNTIYIKGDSEVFAYNVKTRNEMTYYLPVYKNFRTLYIVEE